MTAYIPRWRGEAEEVVAGRLKTKSNDMACGCLFLKAMDLEGHEQEQTKFGKIPNRIPNRL